MQIRSSRSTPRKSAQWEREGALDWEVSEKDLKRNKKGKKEIRVLFIHSFIQQICAEAFLHRDTSLSELNFFKVVHHLAGSRIGP